MRILLAILFGVLFLNLNTSGQTPPTVSPAQLLVKIHQSNPDTSRISLELKLGNYYLSKSGPNQTEKDSAITYFNQAMHLSNELHAEVWKYKTLALIGNYEIKTGHIENGTSAIKQAITFYHQHNDLGNEGRLWAGLADLIDNSGHEDLQMELNCYENAERIFNQLHRLNDELDALGHASQMNIKIGRLDIAETQLLLGVKKSSNMPDKFYGQFFTLQVAQVYCVEGMFHQALYYQLKLIGDLSAKKDESVGEYLAQAGVIYSRLEMYDKALYYNTKALEIFESLPVKPTFYFMTLVYNTSYLLALKKPQIALADLKKAVKKSAPTGVVQRGCFLMNFAQCYAALKQNKMAAKYYDEMMNNYEVAYKNSKVNNFDVNNYLNDICSGVDFFISTSQYKKATDYFNFITSLTGKEATFVSIKIKILPLQIKLDSISGNYKKAFTDLSLYKRINDSVYTSKKSRQIAEMQTQYETSQKEHAIKLLQSQSKTQDLELHATEQERNITFGGVAFLCILTGLAYNRYRFKQKTNIELQARQQEINLKNNSLELLVNDKDRLIEEKDWLLKEVHHRVKNNLHTVICLLESQASYLENDALKAIQISQHRVYAMSLIHQKLYQTNDITSIEIDLYLKEFIGYLQDSFGTDGKIDFKLNLQSVKVSAAQAIPIALIINEAVTNSIKYAFPDSEKGEIQITLKEDNAIIELNIIDNGIGIDTRIINMELESLGLELIKGLTKEIKGKLIIENLNGTVIKITFSHDKLFAEIIS
jgi:two-component sensor histidine kinase